MDIFRSPDKPCVAEKEHAPIHKKKLIAESGLKLLWAWSATASHKLVFGMPYQKVLGILQAN